MTVYTLYRPPTTDCTVALYVYFAMSGRSVHRRQQDMTGLESQQTQDTYATTGRCEGSRHDNKEKEQTETLDDVEVACVCM